MTKKADQRGTAGDDRVTPRLRGDQVAYASLSNDEAAVVQLERREFYTMNATAKLIVQAVDQGASLDEIVTRVAAEFDVSEDACRADVERFLDELANAGVIEI